MFAGSRLRKYIQDAHKNFHKDNFQDIAPNFSSHSPQTQERPMSLPESFNLTAEDAQLLLAANVHLGTKNVQVCELILYLEILIY